MATKEEFRAALANLTALAQSAPPETRAQLLQDCKAVDRFVGELRQTVSAIKEELTALRTERDAATKEVLRLTPKVDELTTKLHDSEQRLKTVRGQLAAADPQKRLPYLVPGTQQPKSTQDEVTARRDQLLEVFPRLLPDMAKAVKALDDLPREEGDPPPVFFLHQDAFAAGYHADEYTLLGMAMKYAGEHGKPVSLVGLNGETIH